MWRRLAASPFRRSRRSRTLDSGSDTSRRAIKSVKYTFELSSGG
jgi:hypothetical protein